MARALDLRHNAQAVLAMLDLESRRGEPLSAVDIAGSIHGVDEDAVHQRFSLG